jgi:hypothetical protein
MHKLTKEESRILESRNITTTGLQRLVVEGYTTVRIFCDGANSDIIPDPDLYLLALASAKSLANNCALWQKLWGNNGKNDQL